MKIIRNEGGGPGRNFAVVYDKKAFIQSLPNHGFSVPLRKKSVYVVQFDSGKIKIGCSQYVPQRIRTLETMGGQKHTRLYATPPCKHYSAIEYQAHSRFLLQRGIGEYFDCNFDDAVTVVKELYDWQASVREVAANV